LVAVSENAVDEWLIGLFLGIGRAVLWLRICGLPWVSGLSMEEVEVCFCDENWEILGKRKKVDENEQSCEERENNNILIKWRKN
jgi:hypothetical protein